MNLKNLITKSNSSIREVLKRIELSGKGCIYVEKNNQHAQKYGCRPGFVVCQKTCQNQLLKRF